jgi:hypothetical protein
MFHNALYPGSSLSRGQFLCYGDLRFGIDAANGHFALGFVDLAPVDDTDGKDESSSPSSSLSSSSYRVTPTLSAWRAVPTSLFAPDDAQFERVDLSPNGNLLGYNADGVEIYDSNYDYFGNGGVGGGASNNSSSSSSSPNSILYFSYKCLNVSWIEEFGTNCAELRGPGVPGSSEGTVTWSIRVLPDDIRDLTTSSPSVSPVPSSSASPSISLYPSSSSSPTTYTPPPAMDGNASDGPTLVPSPVGGLDVAAASMYVEASSIPPAISPSIVPTFQNIFLENDYAVEDDDFVEDDSIESASEYDEYEEPISVATIWGIVWLDSNRNGAIDLGEEEFEDHFKVELYECVGYSEGDDDEEVSPAERMMAGTRTLKEDDVVNYINGTYFIEVPIGKTYIVKFVIDSDVYGFSSGIDTSTNIFGLTVCETLRLDDHIQWDAGLYLIDDPDYEAKLPETIAAVSPTASVNASIGGFVYLDVDENGVMDSNERTAAVGGYTVNDASILVSLTDCNANVVVETLDMSFPGTYLFDDLSEGFYKLRYDMQVIDRYNNTGVPLYSFIDSGTSTFYETKCGKLGNGETIGNVGLRMKALDLTAYSATPYDSTLANNTFEDGSQRTVAKVSEDAESQSRSGHNSFIPGVVGFIVAVSFMALVAVFVSARKNPDLFPFSFLGSKTNDREGSRSAGSSRVGDSSLISADLRSQKNYTGSLIAEINGGGNDSDGSDVEKESYTGLRFSVKKGWGRGNPSEIVIGEINEAGSEGYEVYDDEEGSEQSAVDYGPVVSNIIAKYSEKLGQNEIHHDEELGIDSSNNANCRHCHDETDSTQSYYTGSSRSSDPPAASYKDIPAVSSGWQRDIQNAEIHHQYEIYHSAPINPVGFDGIFGTNQDVSIIDRENNAYTHDDSESSSSDSESDFDFSEEASNPGWTDPSLVGKSSPARVPPRTVNVDWSDTRTRRVKSKSRDGQQNAKHQAAIPENSTMEYSPRTSSIHPIMQYEDNNGSGAVSAADKVEDNKSVVSSGSDQSSDPPGASYKSIHCFPPQPLPRKTTPPPPRRTTPRSPNSRRSTSAPRAPVRGFPSPSPPRR